eukprot:CFRG4651T1
MNQPLKNYFTAPEGTYVLDSKSSLYTRNVVAGHHTKLTYVALDEETVQTEDHLCVASFRSAETQCNHPTNTSVKDMPTTEALPPLLISPKSTRSSNKSGRRTAFQRFRSIQQISSDSTSHSENIKPDVSTSNSGHTNTKDTCAPQQYAPSEPLARKVKEKRLSSSNYIVGLLSSGVKRSLSASDTVSSIPPLAPISARGNGISDGLEAGVVAGYETRVPVGNTNESSLPPGCLMCNNDKVIRCYAFGRPKQTIHISEVLDSVQLTSAPTAHAANPIVQPSPKLLVGLKTGEVVLKHMYQKKAFVFNKSGCINKSKVTSLRWVPGSLELFMVAHADGVMFMYSRERIDPATVMNWKEVGRNVFNGFAVMHPRKASNPITRWRVGKGAINDFKYSPDHKHVAVVSQDGCLRIIDSSEERLVATLQSYFGGLLCVNWSPDGQYIVTGGEDDLVSIWSFERRALVARGEGHSSWVVSVEFDPWVCDEYNYRFGSVGLDQRLLLWDFNVNGLRIPRKKGERFTKAQPTSKVPAVDTATPILPLPRKMAPTFEPICSRVVHKYPLTDLMFRRTAIITACQAGNVKLWTRPQFVRISDTCDVQSTGKSSMCINGTDDDVIGTVITGLSTPGEAAEAVKATMNMHSSKHLSTTAPCNNYTPSASSATNASHTTKNRHHANSSSSKVYVSNGDVRTNLGILCNGKEANEGNVHTLDSTRVGSELDKKIGNGIAVHEDSDDGDTPIDTSESLDVHTHTHDPDLSSELSPPQSDSVFPLSTLSSACTPLATARKLGGLAQTKAKESILGRMDSQTLTHGDENMEGDNGQESNTSDVEVIVNKSGSVTCTLGRVSTIEVLGTRDPPDFEVRESQSVLTQGDLFDCSLPEEDDE